MKKRILATSALPYANGPLHLGHMMEYIQSDIWVRTQKLSGHECYHVCADDAHGTPIMLKAEELKLPLEEMIAKMKAAHMADFEAFGIAFDHYHSTHSQENQQLSEGIFKKLQSQGCIIEKKIEQAYDTEKAMFLPDRYIKGECPRCEAPDQYGDSCESCGSTYDAEELINPYSVLSNKAPVRKKSWHFFFNLPLFYDFLLAWCSEDGRLQPEMKNKLREWFDSGLLPWDITRDAPYFGFPIPGTNNSKYFYVWLDAPVGYMASFLHLCHQRGLTFDDWWQPHSETELHHFIGKDILYFHCLFWPAILNASGYRLPTRIQAHGFLTVNGEKMSKSRGTFITAESYLSRFRPDYLRYYFASRLNGRVEDIDLNLDDFCDKVNADLVGKVVNIASRCSRFIGDRFDGYLLPPAAPSLMAAFAREEDVIRQRYSACDTAAVVKAIMQLADLSNQYINDKRPWKLAKNELDADELHAVASTGIHAFCLLIRLLKPITPELASEAERFLNVKPLDFASDHHLLAQGHRINPFTPLLKRVKKEEAQRLITTQTPSPANSGTTAAEIDIEDFARVDLRVATITAAHNVEGSERLLRLDLDVGKLGKRQVLSGISKHYDTTALKGRQVVYLSNLKTRRMRFGESQGMILAAAANDQELQLIRPDEEAAPGSQVR